MRKIAVTVFVAALAVIKPAWAEPSRVVATIKPVHSLVAGVMGETGTPVLLVEGLASPHTYSLKPSQRQAIDDANIIFYVGNSFETFLAKPLESAPEHVRKVALSEVGGITVLDHREGGVWEAHAHTAHTHAEEAEGEHHHDHEAEGHKDGEHGDDAHAAHDEHHGDLHLWLDPRNAIALTKAIARELGKVYPEHRAVYKENASTQIARLEALDSELKAALSPLKGKPFIVFHDAYQYLERAYSLTAVGSITLEPEQKVSAKRVGEMRTKIQETKAVCVFQEPQFDDKIVATVIEGTSVKRGTLDPEGGAGLTPGPDLYFTLMRNLAGNLKGCLS